MQGEAAVNLSHLPLTVSNYRQGLKFLEDRYSNKRLILKSHMDAYLQASALCIESSEGLRRLQLTLDENLMAKEAMSNNTKVNSGRHTSNEQFKVMKQQQFIVHLLRSTQSLSVQSIQEYVTDGKT